MNKEELMFSDKIVALVGENKEYQIRCFKEFLRRTDYQAIKFLEGEMTEEEYLPIRDNRRFWREQINALELETDE